MQLGSSHRAVQRNAKTRPDQKCLLADVKLNFVVARDIEMRMDSLTCVAYLQGTAYICFDRATYMGIVCADRRDYGGWLSNHIQYPLKLSEDEMCK